jgi:2,4-dienoyl-CoA reductase-like NADH-dependent reductase (Old Yellow Enzyme family)
MPKSVKLFEPLTIRGTKLPNRIVVSPLCQYSAVDGLAQPWHFAHLSTFARGKAGLVFTEATAVEARGRITPQCLGIWTDEQADALRPIVAFIESMGCVAGMQLAHAGRKASTRAPFSAKGPIPLSDEDSAQAGAPWQTVAPSALPVVEGWHVPQALDEDGLKQIREAFVAAARRAVDIGFRALELHMAHGYLLHSFLSPLGNQREDAYGGDLDGRMRFPLEVAAAVRAAIPDELALFARISAIDGREGGWSIEDSVCLSEKMSTEGVDVVDCSSGGIGGAPRFRSDDLFAPAARRDQYQVDGRGGDYRSSSGGRDPAKWWCRPGGAGSRNHVRPLLAVTRRRSTRSRSRLPDVAGAVRLGGGSTRPDQAAKSRRLASRPLVNCYSVR